MSQAAQTTRPRTTSSLKTRKAAESVTRTASPRRPAKVYIDVAYKDRDLAKRLGARWDAGVKRWYCPAGSTLALIYKWRKGPSANATASANDATATLNRTVREVRPQGSHARNAAPSLFDTLELPLAS